MSWFRRHRAIWVSVIIVLLLAAGGGFAYIKFHQDEPSDSVAAPPAAVPSVAGFKADIKNLPNLKSGHYAAWLISASTKTLIGKFNIQADGSLIDVEGKPLADSILPFQGSLVEGDTIQVTLEAANSKDEQPGSAIVLSGILKADGTTALSFSAINLDTATAKYVLATPTDDPDKNETSGLWFGMPGTKPSPGLNLPPAPSGWKYAGWTIYKDKNVLMGKFSDPKAGDDFNGYSASKKPAPNLPGQDFLTNAPTDLALTFPVNLTEGTSKVVLSLEPDLGDNSTSKYLILFSADIPSGLKDHVATDMVKATTLPTATLTYSQ